MQFKCSACNTSIKVSDKQAGKKGKCLNCGAVIEIPALPIQPTQNKKQPISEKQKNKGDNRKKDMLDEIQRKEYARMSGELFARADFLTKIMEAGEKEVKLSKATPGQIVEEFAHRKEAAILISFPIDSIDFENASSITGAEFHISFSDNLSEAEMRSILFGMGLQIARQMGGLQR
ncbi:MAG: hypothetical protein JXA11_07675 [Phycisphaerae bacterium]|nr:hypothetical protein [Phycisphaerae bacterium]